MKKLKLELWSEESGWSTLRLKGVDKDSPWIEINHAIMRAEGSSDEDIAENLDGWRVETEGVVGPIRLCEFRSKRHYLCIGFINLTKQE